MDYLLERTIASLVTLFAGAFIFQLWLIPSKQKNEQLINKLNSFHEKYFKIMDKILSSRLKLVQHFDKCKKSFDILNEEFNEDGENVSKIVKVNQAKTKKYYDYFKEDRKDFVDAKNEYIKHIVSFLNLVYEEHKLMTDNITNKKIVSQLLIWIHSSDQELKTQFRFLDQISRSENPAHFNKYYTKYSKIGLEDYFRRLIKNTSGIDCAKDSSTQIASNLHKITDTQWYSFKKWFFYKSRKVKNTLLVNYDQTRSVFAQDLQIGNVESFFSPFWIEKERYRRVEQKLLNDNLKDTLAENKTKTKPSKV